MEQFYGSTLARVHSEGFSEWLAPAYPWLLERVRSTGARPALWDVGCGDGSWLASVQKSGVSCSGVDRASAFVSMCRHKGLSVVQGEAAQAAIPAGVTAVTALGEVLCYEPAAFDLFVGRLANNLPVGGGIWFDLIGIGVSSSRGQFSKNDWQVKTEVEVSGDILRRHISIQSAQGSLEETHFQKLYTEEAVLHALADHGFEARLLPAYGNVSQLQGRFAVEARRRG